MAWFDVISHARLFLFFTDQPWNPWYMLAEPLGSAEPRLKITGLFNVMHSVGQSIKSPESVPSYIS